MPFSSKWLWTSKIDMSVLEKVTEKALVQLDDRTIIVRRGVGAVGRIEQRIRWSRGECLARPGDAIAIAAGEVIDITNTPGPGSSYGAVNHLDQRDCRCLHQI